MLFISALPVVIFLFFNHVQLLHGANITTLDEFLAQINYDPREPPSKPTNVHISMMILSMNIEDNSLFVVKLYIDQYWIDHRLKDPSSENSTDEQMIKLTDMDLHKIWLPDTYFVNDVKSERHKTILLDNTAFSAAIYPGGDVLYNALLTITLSCGMNLEKFPHDNQTCVIKLESYKHDSKLVSYRWNKEAFEEGAIQINCGRRLSNFQMEPYIDHYVENVSVGWDLYISTMFAKFHFKRLIANYLLNFYIPSVELVVLSWIGFWQRIDAAPARVSLGILTVLAISGLRFSMPQANYTMAITWWYSGCLFLASAAIIEYALVTWVVYRKFESDLLTGTCEHGEVGKMQIERASYVRALKVDRACRWLFPITSAILFIIYWCTFAI